MPSSLSLSLHFPSRRIFSSLSFSFLSFLCLLSSPFLYYFFFYPYILSYFIFLPSPPLLCFLFPIISLHLLVSHLISLLPFSLLSSPLISSPSFLSLFSLLSFSFLPYFFSLSLPFPLLPNSCLAVLSGQCSSLWHQWWFWSSVPTGSAGTTWTEASYPAMRSPEPSWPPSFWCSTFSLSCR